MTTPDYRAEAFAGAMAAFAAFSYGTNAVIDYDADLTEES